MSGVSLLVALSGWRHLIKELLLLKARRTLDIRQHLHFSDYPHVSELKPILAEVWHRVWIDEIFGRAAQLAFFWFFSLFPFLIFLTALVSLLPLPDRADPWLVGFEKMLPGEAYRFLTTTFHQVSAGYHQGLLSFGLLALLWAASAGMESVITCLNRAYKSSRPRAWWKEKLLAMLLTIGFGIFFLAAVIMISFGELLGRELAAILNLGPLFLLSWPVIKLLAVVLLVLLGLELVYFFAPNISQRWELFSPGTILALFFWLVISYGLRLYVAKFRLYDVTYGTIGGVMLLMLWLYLTGIAILVGGEVNSIIKSSGTESNPGEDEQPAV